MLYIMLSVTDFVLSYVMTDSLCLYFVLVLRCLNSRTQYALHSLHCICHLILKEHGCNGCEPETPHWLVRLTCCLERLACNQ